jgi:hypothetical protein
MQFAGKKGIALFVLLVSGAVAIGFGSGLIVGRQFPVHRFERFGETVYLLDPATGKVCNPFKDPNASTNLIDQGLAGNQDPFAPYGGHAVDANGFPIAKPASNYPPACGK